MKSWALVASLLLAFGVVLGAFGAHALSNVLDTRGEEVYKTANFYHFVHALGLLLVVVLPEAICANSQKQAVCWLLVIGVFLFSGSLYVLAISGIKILGAITPLGGLCFIAAWSLLAWRVYR